MPQASQQVWDKYKEIFETDTVDDGPATAYLESQGWKLRRDFCWTPREGFKKGDEILDKEKYAILFLIEEWDYGGVVYPEQEEESLDGMSHDDKFYHELTSPSRNSLSSLHDIVFVQIEKSIRKAIEGYHIEDGRTDSFEKFIAVVMTAVKSAETPENKGS